MVEWAKGSPEKLFKEAGPLIVWEPAYPHARETLLLHLDSSPLLNTLYTSWRSELQITTVQEIFDQLLVYLRTVVFDMKLCQHNKIKDLVKEAALQKSSDEFCSSLELPIEYFVEKRAGLCRHFTLVAYYFLQRLNQETLLPRFSIEIIRMPIETHGILGRHAWLSIFFEEENRSFHFDPFWSIVIDKADPEAKQTLKNKYGL